MRLCLFLLLSIPVFAGNMAHDLGLDTSYVTLLPGSEKGQYIPVPFTHPSGGGGPAFVQANFGATNSAVTSIATPSQTTTATDLLYAFTVVDIPCSTGASNGSWAVTDTGGDTFTPIVPNGTGIILTIGITQVGTGYSTTPSMTISGCSANGTYGATCSGSAPNLTCSGYNTTVAATGCGPSLPTVSFSGGSPTVPEAAVVTAVGVAGGHCTAAFYCSSLAGTSNNIVTFTHPSATFSALTIEEFSGVSTIDAEADGESTSSVSSVTTGSYSTTVNAEAAVFGSALVNTGCSWTPTSGWTIPSAGTPASGSGVYCMNSEYKILSSTVSGVTTQSAVGSKSADMTGILATFH